MTVEKIKTAIANIEAYLSECHGNDDTVTLTANVIRSVKENYEELVEAKAEIERLELNLEEAFAEIEEFKTLQIELVNEFAEKLKAKFSCMEYVIKTSRKTMPVERVKAEVDAVLQNGCLNIIDKILKEVTGDTQCEQ